MIAIRIPKNQWGKAWRAMISVAPVRLVANDPIYEVLPAHLDLLTAQGIVFEVVRDVHVAGAVLPFGDLALELGVIQGMILDVHRQALVGGIERRPFRHRPALEDAVGLETKIVMQPAGVMFLDDEDGLFVLLAGARRTLGGRVKMPLRSILLEAHMAVRERNSRTVRHRCETRTGWETHPTYFLGMNVARTRWPMRRSLGPAMISMTQSSVRTSLKTSGSMIGLRFCLIQSEIFDTLPFHC